MNYKVLYRKYRPSTFEEIIGQKNIVKILQSSIIDNKIAHAYIFTGPRGTGKTSTAKVLAKTLNCQDLQSGEPCGWLSALKLWMSAIVHGSHPHAWSIRSSALMPNS